MLMLEKFITALALILFPLCLWLSVGAWSYPKADRDHSWAVLTVAATFACLASSAWLIARFIL